MTSVINTKIIKRLKDLQIPLDKAGSLLLILFALYEKNIAILDAFDDGNKERRAILLYKLLEKQEFIEEVEGDVHYEITQRGIDLVTYVKHELNKSTQNEVSAEAFVTDTLAENVEDWIEEYIKLFPAGITQGKMLRKDKPLIISKMQRFVLEHGEYDKEVILKATRTYLREEAKKQYIYCRMAHYFIYKVENVKGRTESSDLANWCEHVVANPVEEDTQDAFENSL